MGCFVSAVGGNSILPPNSDTRSKRLSERKQVISLLQKCKNVGQMKQIHARIIRNGQDQDHFVIFQLLRLCSTFNSISYGAKTFRYTRFPNAYLYTALIDGLVVSGSYIDGIRLYAQMVTESIEPDAYVVTSVLKACGFQMCLEEGTQVHGQILKLGLSSNRSIKMKLMELYGKCGSFRDAHNLFDKMPERDVVASTAMIDSYLQHGMLEDAIDLFNGVQTKDTVCWTAMIDGLVRNGEMNKALEVFRKMQSEGVRPNEVTIVCVLTACSQLGTLELGRWVHSYMEKYEIKLNHLVGGALINAYWKCGSIDEAQRVYRDMKVKDVSTYNSMIAGLAMHGKSVEAIEIFQDMIKQGVRPSSITFVGVLNACSHAGLLDLGHEILHSMTRDYEIEPRIEHYGCMVDLLGRLGHLEEAYKFIEKMEIAPDHIMLGSLLSACKIHGNLELGEKVAKMLLDYGAADSGTYVLLSNAYALSQRWKEAAEVRAKMKASGIEKEPGCSSIELNNEVHEFLLGDLRHPQRDEIYKKLEEMNEMARLKGYAPATEIVMQDIDDQEKEWALAIHSEKLAVCYGLISTKTCTTIRVANNLRMCSDCHSMIKLIAKITGRKIVVRDRKRFHHFENGFCSCGDYW